jgi:uncharacterized protein (TIGR03905 family)
MKTTFTTQGTCAKFIDIELDGDIVVEVRFIGGCHGNLQAVSRLIQGERIDRVIEVLRGIVCRSGTSCSDQLARALEATKLSMAS